MNTAELNFGLVLLLCLLKFSSAQDSNCDFYQNVSPGSTHSIYSPNWPGNYYAGQSCRYILRCPQGYNCRLECPEIRMPQSASCSMDRILVSLTGDTQLAGAQKYCGTGSLGVTSTGTQIIMGLLTSRFSTGGRFQCRGYAVTAKTMALSTSQQQQQQCRCGERRQNRIVGGEETGVNEYTMMAGLIDLTIRTIKCGATIISPRNLVTAAHCMYQSFNNFAVVVGEHDVGSGNLPRQVFAVTRFISHPAYTPSNYDFDIMIVTVSGTIEFNDRVLPVCLPFKFVNNDFAGATVTLLGWGLLFDGGPRARALRKVDLDVLSQSACMRQGTVATDRQMCTYTPGRDACQDDSGGPLLYTDPSTGLLFNIGVISYGHFCASPEPGINTRVTVLLDWIVNNAERYDYCVK